MKSFQSLNQPLLGAWQRLIPSIDRYEQLGPDSIFNRLRVKLIMGCNECVGNVMEKAGTASNGNALG